MILFIKTEPGGKFPWLWWLFNACAFCVFYLMASGFMAYVIFPFIVKRNAGWYGPGAADPERLHVIWFSFLGGFAAVNICKIMCDAFENKRREAFHLLV